LEAAEQLEKEIQNHINEKEKLRKKFEIEKKEFQE
jgi:hypothetical protein